MDWKDIAAVSGKGGLFQVIKPTRAGFILESVDKDRKRFIAGPSTRVSVLHEISIYTDEDAVALSEVMLKIKKDVGEVKVSAKSEGADLMAFLKSVVPNYDEERVYVSDVKKVVSWYAIINEFYPELLEEPKEEAKKDEEVVVKKEKEADVTESDVKKKAPAKKKVAAKTNNEE